MIKSNTYRALLFVALTVLAALALAGALLHAQSFVFFAAAIAKVALSVVLLWAIDTYLLPEIDLTYEIKNGNIAYSLFFLGLCLIVGLSISTA